MTVYRFVVPIRTAPGLNVREHWHIRAERVAKERLAVAVTFPRAARGLLPCVVTMVRHSPGTLDDDNLQGALKGIRDEIATQLGCDDRDPRVRFLYEQAKGKHGVLVLLEKAA